MTMLAIRGRKRKSGRRHPNGDLAERRPNDRLLVALQPHRVWLPKDHRLSDLAENPLGCYQLTKVIDPEQAEAGRLYAVAVGRLRASIETPRGMTGSGRGYDCNADLCADPSWSCECRARMKRYNELYEALAGAGRKAMMVVNRVAVRQQHCMIGEREALRAGLDALVHKLGLTGQRKSSNSRN